MQNQSLAGAIILVGLVSFLNGMAGSVVPGSGSVLGRITGRCHYSHGFGDISKRDGGFGSA